MSGIITADRLPSEVPENQIFTIDTLIEVTGPVSEESEMQWTLDDQNWQIRTATLIDTLAAYPVSAEEGDAINNLAAVNGEGDITNAGLLNSLWVSSWMYNRLMYPGATQTWEDFLADLDDGNYNVATTTDTGSIHNIMLNPTEEIMILTWTDSLRNDGGKLSLSKNIDFDSQEKSTSLSNLEVEKVLTYASTEGNHLIGAEEWTLNVAGTFEKTADSIRCVFASSNNNWFPAFCNVVKAKSEIVNINSVQISTKGESRSVSKTGDIPAMLNYQIAVSPESSSGSGFADGTVKTFLGGSIMEAHANNLEPSSKNDWKDSASVSGGIKRFQKSFKYESGITRSGDEDTEMKSSSGDESESITGIINVNIISQCIGPTWIISGGSYSQSGSLSTILQGVPAGTYSFTWNGNYYGSNTINSNTPEITFEINGC